MHFRNQSKIKIIRLWHFAPPTLIQIWCTLHTPKLRHAGFIAVDEQRLRASNALNRNVILNFEYFGTCKPDKGTVPSQSLCREDIPSVSVTVSCVPRHTLLTGSSHINMIFTSLSLRIYNFVFRTPRGGKGVC